MAQNMFLQDFGALGIQEMLMFTCENSGKIKKKYF